MELGAVAREIDALEQVQAELASVADRNDDRRRHDLIELRRKLSAQITRIGQVAGPVISDRNDPALLQAFRQKFSQMRSAAAIHQASWPAVSLGERKEEYRASAISVREANRAFVAWMRETLERMRQEFR